MRHLFVPACLCLMTFASATAPEPNLPTGDVAGVSSVDKKISAPDSTDDVASDTALTANAEAVIVGIPQAEALPVLLPLFARLPPVMKPVVPRTHAEICESLTQAALSNDLPAAFFIHLLFQESRFRPEVVSNAGAQGIAQFMPETSASVGLDNPFDPLEAIPASARLLRDLFHQFGNLGLAAAAYNAGPKRIQDWLAKKGKLPEETQGYVKTITGRPAETWTVAQTGSPALKLPKRAPCQEAAGLLAWNGPEQIPLPPTRTPVTPVLTASKGKAMLEARAKAKTDSKTNSKAALKTALKDEKKAVAADAGAPAVKTGTSAKGDKADTAGKAKAAAVQLAASKQKKKQKPLRLTQR